MQTLENFIESNRLVLPVREKAFCKELWKENAVPKTDYWYTQFFEIIGKEGTSALLRDVNKYNYLAYKSYLGSKRHLDVGSGTGLASLYIHINSRNPVEMLDVYDNDIAEEVKLEMMEDKNFHFTLYGQGDKVPFEDQSFDSASLFYVLHHCENRDVSLRLLKDIRRILQKGSYLIVIEEPVVSVPDRERLDHLDKLINSYYASSGFDRGLGFDIANFYTKPELEDQFAAAGFAMVHRLENLEWSWLLPRSLYILSNE
ncbi:MAG: class I SAM-dependent methyltransferase [Minisyncoccia bacterium]|jgi:ubiquinone/menaquinone biosynthesis C-methylase UbiE